MNVVLVGEIRASRIREFVVKNTGEVVSMVVCTVETSFKDEEGNDLLGMQDFNFFNIDDRVLLQSKGKYIAIPMVYKASTKDVSSSLKQINGAPYQLYDKNPFIFEVDKSLKVNKQQ